MSWNFRENSEIKANDTIVEMANIATEKVAAALVITKRPDDYGVAAHETKVRVLRVPAHAFLYLLGDVMVLVDFTDEEVKKYNDEIVDVMSRISLTYGVLPMIIGKNYEHFYQWVPYLPFYRNVKTEGIEYYAG